MSFTFKKVDAAESDVCEMRAAFEAKYQRDWDDSCSDEMRTVWVDAWIASHESLAPQKEVVRRSVPSLANLESLQLLSQVSDYLSRMPPVPLTQQLIRRLEAHLADPQVAQERRNAEAKALESSTRVGKSFSPEGRLLYEAKVEGDTLFFSAPKYPRKPGSKDKLSEQLHEGIVLVLKAVDVD